MNGGGGGADTEMTETAPTTVMKISRRILHMARSYLSSVRLGSDVPSPES